MSVQVSVREFLEDVRRYNSVMDGPSGDAESEAACAMRDSALAMLRELGVQGSEIAELLKGFDSGENMS